jgi:2-amino-4-hydroxy-6-hydroxymethyldihydropteridine diphosphokinase
VTRAFLGLGSNLGDRRQHLRDAVDTLSDPGAGLGFVAVSPLYETDPVGGPDQDRFLNLVVELDTACTPRELLAVCHRLESAAGRVRDERWGPRTLDVDVVTVDGPDGPVTSHHPELLLPHPGTTERATVLRPWLDVEPDAVLPGHGPVAALLAALGREAETGMRRRDDLVLAG